MGLLDRLHAWLGLESEDASEPGTSDADETGQEEQRLDPSNVTEVRTESDDDPVEALGELDDGNSAGEDDED